MPLCSTHGSGQQTLKNTLLCYQFAFGCEPPLLEPNCQRVQSNSSWHPKRAHADIQQTYTAKEAGAVSAQAVQVVRVSPSRLAILTSGPAGCEGPRYPILSVATSCQRKSAPSADAPSNAQKCCGLVLCELSKRQLLELGQDSLRAVHKDVMDKRVDMEVTILDLAA
eukprot:3541206-Amphidinium_carterae.1